MNKLSVEIVDGFAPTRYSQVNKVYVNFAYEGDIIRGLDKDFHDLLLEFFERIDDISQTIQWAEDREREFHSTTKPNEVVYSLGFELLKDSEEHIVDMTIEVKLHEGRYKLVTLDGKNRDLDFVFDYLPFTEIPSYNYKEGLIKKIKGILEEEL